MPAFSVSKSILINAPIGDVFAEVRDFKRWPSWSPWLVVEPDARLSYADDGNSYSWEGNIVGSGQMAVIDEKKEKEIHYELTFLKPWKSQAEVAFHFEETREGTEVVWTMQSRLPFLLFWMKGLMTAMCGMDYQRGLTMLKDLVELGSVPSQLDYKEDSLAAQTYVGLERDCSIDEMGPKMKADLETLGDFIKTSGIEPAGPPLTVYLKWEMAKGNTRYRTGFPVNEVPENLPNGFMSAEIPAMSVYSIVHTGPYRHLGNAWSSGMMRMRAKVFAKGNTSPPFEVYLNPPDEVPEEEIITVVNFPLKA